MGYKALFTQTEIHFILIHISEVENEDFQQLIESFTFRADYEDRPTMIYNISQLFVDYVGQQYAKSVGLQKITWKKILSKLKSCK